MAYDLTGKALYPLGEILSQQEFPLADLLPAQDGDRLFGDLYYTDAEANFDSEGLHLDLRLAWEGEIALSPPGLPDIALVIAAGGNDWTSLETEFVIGSNPAALIRDAPISLRIPRSLLQPMRSPTEINTEATGVEIGLGNITFGMSGADLVFDVNATIDLPLCMIGTTGVVIEAQGVTLHLDDAHPAPGQPAGWRGIHIATAHLYLPGDIGAATGALALTDAYIGNGGFTGHISTDWQQGLSFSLFGIETTLFHAGVTFVQNALTGCELHASMLLPFFDSAVDVHIAFDLNGQFSIALAAPAGQNGLLTLTQANVFELHLDSLGFMIGTDGKFAVCLSGALHPLIPGIDWPTINVKGLCIDSEGHIQIEGGWLDMGDQCHLDFYGFQVEISKIGFGSTEDGGKWIGFSGSLQLISGLSAGASVDGLRITWYPHGHFSVTLSGVGVEISVPGAFSFKGHVSYREPSPGEHRFDGKVRLHLDALDMTLDGEIVIGTRNGRHYFAIYVELDLPAGIPLWTTGLGIYGFAGLFALQMEPDRAPDQPWYGIEPGQGWYKTPPVGVTGLNKWRYGEGSVGVGIGITLGTVPDNGYLFNGRALFALVIPGPLIFIEGKANILRSRATLAEDPMLHAIIVIDGRAGTFQVGLDAQYKFAGGGEVIEIGGGADLLFSFHDPSAWHLYIGKRDPRTARIHAYIFLHLFGAEAYFMLDPRQLAVGAWIGYDKTFHFGPVRIIIEAWMEGNALIGFKPVHFHGDIWLHGRLAVTVFGIGFDLGADARVGVDVFKPFHILIELSVHIGLPWPFPDINVGISLEWGPEKEPPPLPLPLKEVSIAHLEAQTSWPLPREGAVPLLLPNYLDGGDDIKDGMRRDTPVPALAAVENAAPPANVPVVPLDCRPQITFGRSVRDDAGVSVNQQPAVEWETIGDPQQNHGQVQVRYGLRSVALERWENGAWVTEARRQAPAPITTPEDVGDLFGSWAPVPSSNTLTPWEVNLPPGVGQTKLLLCSKNPFDYTRNVSDSWYNWWISEYGNYPCVNIPPNEEICCRFADAQDAGGDSLLQIARRAGDVPLSPVYCPAHPEFRLGWDLPIRPTASVDTQGNVTLQFAPGDEATLILDRDVLSVRLQVAPCGLTGDGGGGGAGQQKCADFTGLRSGTNSNPLQESGFTFTVSDARGIRLPQTTVRSVRGSAGAPVSGLDVGWQCDILLPQSAEQAVLEMTCSGTDVKIQAFDAAGRNIASGTALHGVQVTATLTAPSGQAFTRLFLTAPSNEALLHRLCTGDAGGGGGGVSPNRGLEIYGQRRDGLLTGPYPIVNGIAEAPGADLVALLVRGYETLRGHRYTHGFCIQGYCVTVGLTADETAIRTAEQLRTQEETGRWSSAGFVFRPYTQYRLRIVTTIRVQGWPYESDVPFNGEREQTEFAFFRTDGPPGVARLMTPLNISDPNNFRTGLEDLTRYVEQTIPPTVPPSGVGDGAKALLPRPVYRGYDVGVAFRQSVNYVDLMYRSSWRDLGLYLFDNNDRPARDVFGRLLTGPNRWGEADRLTLNETDEQWVSLVNASSCASIDTQHIYRARTLGTDGVTLDPRTPYEARLVPLLLHEGFRTYTVGQTVGGTGAVLAGIHGSWRVTDQGNAGGPSVWQIGETPNVGPDHTTIGWILQTSAHRSGRTTANTILKPGTLLVRVDDPGLSANAPDQPSQWTNYRLTATLRSGDDDGIGLAFRWRDDQNYYLFSMDAQDTFRRLICVSGGNWTGLAEDAIAYVPGNDYVVSIEAIGSRLRVLVNGALVFDIEDPTHVRGSIALYSWDNVGARFADIRVDDLRGIAGGAAVVYRFPFLTSRFANFVHHLHSGDGTTWRKPLADRVGIATAFSAGVSVAALPASLPDPSGLEAKGYFAIAEKALGPTARQDGASVEAYRIQDAGGGNTAVALLVRTGDPIDWSRIHFEVSYVATGVTPLPPVLRPMPDAIPATETIRIVGWTPGVLFPLMPVEESITLLLTDTGNLTGWRLERRTLPGANAPAQADGTVLAEDAFVAAPAHTAQVISSLPFNPPMNSLREFAAPINLPPSTLLSTWTAVRGTVSQTSTRGGGSGTGFPGALLLPITPARSDARLTVRFQTTAATGAVGVVFRYQSPDRYYRFSVGMGTGSGQFRRLERREPAGFVRLWQDHEPTSTGKEYALMVEFLGSQIVVSLDKAEICRIWDGPPAQPATPLTQGDLGFYVYRNAGVSFTDLQVATLVRRLDTWEIHDTPTVFALSAWRKEGGILQQTASVAGASAATANAASLYSIALWQPAVGASVFWDCRIRVLVRVAPNDVAGVFFRWSAPDSHYLFLLDRRNGIASLVRHLSGGSFTTLWQGPFVLPAAEWPLLVIETTGSRLRATLDGIALCDLFDPDGPQQGSVGLHGGLTGAAAYGQFHVEAAEPQWEAYHTFANEETLPAGQRVCLIAGHAADARHSPVTSEHRRFREASVVSLPPEGVDLRLLRPDGQAVQAGRYVPDTLFLPFTASVLRAPDGTGFLLFVPDSGPVGARLPDGKFQLAFTFRRDNRAVAPDSVLLKENGDSGDEITSLIIDNTP